MKKLIILVLLLSGSFLSKGQAKFEVISKGKDNKGRINRLSVFVSSMTEIKKVNPILWAKYKTTGIATFQIFYYDDKKIAMNYDRLLYDKRITDTQIDKISKHVVGKFEYVLGKENLYVGEDALLN